LIYHGKEKLGSAKKTWHGKKCVVQSLSKNICKSQDITNTIKVRLMKRLVWSIDVNDGWTVKKADHRRTEASEMWCFRRLLRFFLDMTENGIK